MRNRQLKILSGISISLLFINFWTNIIFLNIVLYPLFNEYNIGFNSEYLFIGNIYLNLIFSYLIITITIFMAPFILYLFRLDINRAIFFGIISTALSIVYVLFPLIMLLYYTSNLPYHLFVFALIIPAFFTIIMIYLIWKRHNINVKEEALIRTTVLDIGTQYPDFKLNNVARRCNVDRDTCLKVIKKMINNNQIFAEYFYVTKKFAFNKKANSEKIDELMALYEEWEGSHIAKLD